MLGGVAAGANERTPSSSTEKKEARIRAEDGLQEMKTGWCRLRWAFWRHPFIGGEQMPAPGGTAVHTSSAKKGPRPLASRSRGSETLCIFIASSNCIVNYHEKGFRVLFCRANRTTHFSMPFSTPIFQPSSRPSRPLPHPCHNHHRRWPLGLAALQTFRNPRG